MPEPGATVAEQFETMEQQVRAGLAGMWVFLATEMLFFGGLFVGFAIYRSHLGTSFAAAAGHLDLVLGSINTGVLLTSGFCMSLADPAMEARDRRRVLALLGATAGLGLVFIGIKGVEYLEEFHKHLMPIGGLAFDFPGAHPERARLFFGYYYALTGLHALHMTIGICAIGVLLILAWRWREPAKLARQVRITSLYWAFVDVVWMFVFASLYLLRR